MDDKLDPRQIEFLKGYNDPKSKTFGNALQSAVKAGYSQEYAENITSLMPDWLSESIGRRKRLLEKAEKNLENLLDSEDEKIQADMSKFVTKTLGKNEGYSERVEQDITSAGKPIPLLGGITQVKQED
jgi:phage terminase small subunit